MLRLLTIVAQDLGFSLICFTRVICCYITGIMYIKLLGTYVENVHYLVCYIRYIPFPFLHISNLMGTTSSNDHYMLSPMVIFSYVLVHNAMESMHYDNKTNNKITTTNQYLEPSIARKMITTEY
jgi:hypothetical protein